jgi:hypothetical protein
MKELELQNKIKSEEQRLEIYTANLLEMVDNVSADENVKNELFDRININCTKLISLNDLNYNFDFNNDYNEFYDQIKFETQKLVSNEYDDIFIILSSL